jgi:hypothetical protein
VTEAPDRKDEGKDTTGLCEFPLSSELVIKTTLEDTAEQLLAGVLFSSCWMESCSAAAYYVTIQFLNRVATEVLKS